MEETDSQKPLVAIVGRPNVGKSTLFNRLIGTRTAVTSDVAGTTRDRLYGDGEWQGRTVAYIDTGGLTEDGGEMAAAVNDQVREAIDECDLVLFLVDVAAGVAAEDNAVAAELRRSGKPVILVAAKADNPSRFSAAAELYAFGLGDPQPVSALHGKGTGDLLDRILTELPQPTRRPTDAPREYPTLAIIGRPNVGKSTLYNALAGKALRITSAAAHTTRDVAATDVGTPDGLLRIIDTAGVQRRGKTRQELVRFSLVRTLRMINDADVVALVLDAEEGPTTQDAHVVSYVLEAGRALVVVVNKWDLVEKTGDIQDIFYDRLSDKLGFLPNPPVVFVSALTGARLDRLARAAYDVWEISGQRVETTELNKLLRQHLERLPGSSGRRPPKLYYATQVGVRPPTFAVFVNNVQSWQDNHRRFLTNLIRDEFGFYGTPISLKLRPKTERTEVAA